MHEITINEEAIQQSIFTIRDKEVMLDRAVATKSKCASLRLWLRISVPMMRAKKVGVFITGIIAVTMLSKDRSPYRNGRHH